MGEYTLKFLEIKEWSEQSLKVTLTIDDVEKPYIINLSPYTYQSISKTLTSFEDYYLRLSLIVKRNPFNNTYQSSVTCIKAKEQRKLIFNCDESYFELIEKIREIDSFEELKDVEQIVEVKDEVEIKEEDSKEIDQTVPQKQEEPKKRFTFINFFKSFVVLIFTFAIVIWFSVDYFSANDDELSLAENSHPITLVENESKNVEESDEDSSDSQTEQKNDSDQEDINSLPEEDDKVEEESQQDETSYAFYEVESVTYALPKGYVALTFDDGPSVFTKQIVDILTSYDVAGTFFFVGKHVEKYPEYVAYTLENGQAIASHSHTHVNLLTISSDEFYKETVESIAIIEEISGEKVNMFRPPYGVINDELKASFVEHDIKTIMWNRDPRDWESRNKDAILKYFYEFDPSGGIYILHENAHTVAALPEVIEYLKELNLEIVGLQ